MTIKPNRYVGRCDICSEHVDPLAGWVTAIDGKHAVLCRQHGPKDRPPIIRIEISARHGADRALVKTTSFLGPEMFNAFRHAVGNAKFLKDEQANLVRVADLGAIVGRLVERFAIDANPDVLAACVAEDAKISSEIESAAERIAVVDQLLAASGKQLMAFQDTGVRWLAVQQGGILADDMGLGKTIQALIAAPTGAGIVIVCPKVAKGVWVGEAKRWRPDLSATVLERRGSFRWPQPGEMVVLNYELLPADGERDAIVAATPTGVILIADEGHMLKGIPKKVARSRSFRELGKSVRNAGGRTWIITGTPLLNDPSELWNLLAHVGCERTVFGTWEDFVDMCGGRPGQYGGLRWGGKIDPSVPERLRRASIRRLKSEVMREMPEKIVDIIDVDLADLGKAGRKELDQLAEHLREIGVDVDGALEFSTNNQAIEFSRISRAREVLAKAKVGAALAMAAELEDTGEPVLMLSAHKKAVEAFGGRDGWAVITGDTADAERQEIARKFQAGELRGIAGTIQAMGVAITLTRASEGIVIDPVPTPGLNTQAEDRLHRISQERTVRIRYLRADHPIDHLYFRICGVKARIAARTVDAAAAAPNEVRAPAAATLADALNRGSNDDADEMDEIAREIRALHAEQDTIKRTADVRRACETKAGNAIRTRGIAVPASSAATGPAGIPRAASSAEERWAGDAIMTLAGMCDGAVTEDGVGFSKTDVAIGHAFALSISSGIGLTTAEWAVAIHICRTYPRQVGRPSEGDAERNAFVWTRGRKHGAEWCQNESGDDGDDDFLFSEAQARDLVDSLPGGITAKIFVATDVSAR